MQAETRFRLNAPNVIAETIEGEAILVDLRTGDPRDLPWPDDRFDACCVNSLELWGPEVLTELRRVLKPDGRVAIAVPESRSKRMASALWRAGFVCVRGNTRYLTARAA